MARATIAQLGSAFYATMSYLGHKDGLKRVLTPYENIKHHLILGQSDCTEAKIDPVLNLLGLMPQRKTPCQQLSMGQRRKVALAALMLRQTPLWILDEPFTALDGQSTQTIKNCISHHLNLGGMLIIASHTALEHPGQSILNLSKENAC